MTLNGFNSLELLSKTQCKPFSANRDGITIGEGAAAFLMSKEKGPVEFLGAGETSDAYHQTSPHPEGLGAQKAMVLALKDAQLSADDISYINLHGTATRHNDSMESHAVFNVFGDKVPCSSTKSMTGHMLGAAGACEAAFLWVLLNPELALQYMPLHIWDGAYDEELSPINLLKAGHIMPVNGKKYMLSNSFGFGGSNVSLIFGSVDDL
jgi:3-oxoacyl-[acyl-carrier-protein] synthase-1